MITVACVNWRNYLGYGQLYVDTLRASVARHLKYPHRFEVIEDANGPDGCELDGWWVKLALFQPGRFKGRVLYLDLDSVIVGPLDELVENKGIIDMHDWGWDAHHLNSSVMVWDAGEHERIFTGYKPAVGRFFCVGGDQEWITQVGGWDPLPKQMVRSYRYHSMKAVQPGCSVVTFHGTPKPHEVLDGWVPKHWSLE